MINPKAVQMRNNVGRYFIALMGVMVLLSFVPVESSFAAACSTTTCTLDVWNTSVLQGSGDTITVTLNPTLNTLTFTFNDGAGTPDPDYKVLKTIGWNGLVDGTAAIGFHLGADGQLSAFGFFNTVYDKNTPIGPGPFPTSFTFFGITDNSLVGATFAVHVQYQGDCSGWVGNGTLSPNGNGNGCGTVPEPASLLLLGSGLAGIGLWQWTRRKEVKA